MLKVRKGTGRQETRDDRRMTLPCRPVACSFFFACVLQLWRAEGRFEIVEPGGGTASPCADSEDEYSGLCYVVRPQTKSFVQAEAFCVERGGHLASFQSTADWEFLKSVAGSRDNVWIGAQTPFTFTDGTSFRFMSDLEDRLREECVHINDNERVEGEECSADRNVICEIPGACATGPGTTHNGMCYKPMIGATDFENGKEDCEQESGHMVTYHSQDKLDFLLTLKGDDDSMWIGAKRRNNEILFTDGGGNFATPGQDLDDRCLRMQENDNHGYIMNGMDCDVNYRFMCALPPRTTVFTPAAEQAALAPLFDLDATTCVDAAPLVALPQQSVFAGRMGLVAPGGGASIALRVTFEAAVTCEDRPVLGVEIASTCPTFKLCDVVNPNATSTSCDFRCPCGASTCDVVFLEKRATFTATPVRACAVQLI